MLNEQFIYDLFAEQYYKRIYDIDDNKRIHVYESIRCLLKSYYTRKLKRKLFDSKIVVLSIGDAIHRLIQDVLREKGYQIEPELEFEYNDIVVVGHPDILTDNFVIELKSVSRIPKRPLTEHLLQTTAYIRMAEVNEGYIVYIGKSSGKVKIFRVLYDAISFHHVVTRANFLSECLTNNHPPLPEVTRFCKYCEYQDLCIGKNGGGNSGDRNKFK